MYKLFWRTHLILRLFTVPFMHPYSRSARVLVLTSIWLGALTVNIWLYSMMATECCIQVSGAPGCCVWAQFGERGAEPVGQGLLRMPQEIDSGMDGRLLNDMPTPWGVSCRLLPTWDVPRPSQPQTPLVCLWRRSQALGWR